MGSGLAVLAWLSAAGAAAAPGDYDAQLCVTAQRMIAGAATLPVQLLHGTGDGFHRIQMDADAATGRAVVAMATRTARASDGRRAIVAVACKMIDRERARTVLGVEPAGGPVSCRDINEATARQALASLDEDQRRRYLASGRLLRFVPDTLLPGGGAWLPARVEDYIRRDADALLVSAPAVRVPWDPAQRLFYQGVQHCKLISFAAMRAWMLAGAFSDSDRLFSEDQAACAAPAAPSRAAGSCRFYFAPAQAMFCEDYNGPGWTADSARAACGRRHASAAALRAAGGRYEGTGGLYSERPCAERTDQPVITTTCVFNCGRPRESAWQLSGELPGGSAMLDKACDLVIDRRERSSGAVGSQEEGDAN